MSSSSAGGSATFSMMQLSSITSTAVVATQQQQQSRRTSSTRSIDLKVELVPSRAKRRSGERGREYTALRRGHSGATRHSMCRRKKTRRWARLVLTVRGWIRRTSTKDTSRDGRFLRHAQAWRSRSSSARSLPVTHGARCALATKQRV